MDATGYVAEYIRSGLKWDEWLTNFKNGIFLNDLYGMNAMVIDVTLTLPGMLDMKNLIDLAIKLQVKSYVKITFDFDPSAIMSPMCLPRDILNPILDELIDYERINGNELTRIYSQTFEDMKTRPNFSDKYSDYVQGLRNGKNRYKQIDIFRKEETELRKIMGLNPKVLEWYSNI
jgi:hypothetical protein